MPPTDGPSDLAHRLAEAMQQSRRIQGLEAALTIGGVILDGWFGGDLEGWRNKRGARTIRDLTRQLPADRSAATLYRFVAITALCRRMDRTRFDHCGTSHLRQVLPLAIDDQVDVVDSAERLRWTVEQVADEVRRRRTVQRRRARPIGSFQVAAAHLQRWARHPARLQDLDRLDQLPLGRAKQFRDTVRSAARDLRELERALDAAIHAAERDGAPGSGDD